jgi:hypothetical protein
MELAPLAPGSKWAYGNGGHSHHLVKQTTCARGYGFRLLLSFLGLTCLLVSSLGILRFSPTVFIRNKSPFLIHSESGPYLIEARHGAVASENHRCSVIGVDILKGGGNALDAAIGATFCIGVVNMFSCVVCYVYSIDLR